MKSTANCTTFAAQSKAVRGRHAALKFHVGDPTPWGNLESPHDPHGPTITLPFSLFNRHQLNRVGRKRTWWYEISDMKVGHSTQMKKSSHARECIMVHESMDHGTRVHTLCRVTLNNERKKRICIYMQMSWMWCRVSQKPTRTPCFPVSAHLLFILACLRRLVRYPRKMTQKQNLKGGDRPAVLSYQRRPFYLRFGEENVKSSYKSERGWPLGEANV